MFPHGVGLSYISWQSHRGFLDSIHNPRQLYREGRSADRLALDRDVAAHHLTKAPADREPEARTTVLARGGGGGLGKLLEQLAHLLLRHADAGVGNRDDETVAAIVLSLPRVDGDGAMAGELGGIAHEVQQRLPQPHLIGLHYSHS